MKAKSRAVAGLDPRSLLAQEIAATKEEYPATKEVCDGVIGRTMFDGTGSEDLTVTVLLSQDRVQTAPSQSLVRIVSRPDNRKYLGMVVAGPFAEPDSLRADSPILLAVATRETDYLPRYHGRVQVKLLGEELNDGSVVPPRLRPLPHSAVTLLSESETSKVLKAEGDLRLGAAVGHEGVSVGIPSTSKAVLPRHTAILGTTGGGKSTTVAGLIAQAVAAKMAVIVLDVEGEYTFLHEPTRDAGMIRLLGEQGMRVEGIKADAMSLYHLVGRETTNPAHPNTVPFSLQFARLSPYTVMAMMDCNDAQMDRFLFAYETAKSVMRELGMFPEKEVKAEERERQEQFLLRLDDFDRGYPRMRLSFLLDIVGKCKSVIAKSAFTPFNEILRDAKGQEVLNQKMNIKDLPSNPASWGKVHSLLWRLHRLKVFDRQERKAQLLRYRDMLQPGRVSVVDLSDAGMTELSNIAVADILRGLHEEQDRSYRMHEQGKGPPPARVLIVMEEAHEFLSSERLERTSHLFDQVARLAKRGRKRWLSLAFVTQLPQHLPRQVLGLCNNFILHKLNDPLVVNNLKHTVSGVDEALWTRLSGLVPGQAIVSFGHMSRPMLTNIDPTGCRLRLVD